MPEYAQWRVEEYLDAMDPFGTTQYYVMHGNLMIAQCEIPAHAERILAEHARLERYERALELIAGMTSDRHDLAGAITAALAALEERD